MAEQLPQRPDEFDRELDFGFIIKFMSVIAAVTVVVFLGMWLLSGFLENRLTRIEATVDTSPLLEPGKTTTPPEPHLQTQPYADWAEMEASQNHVLATYGWEDESAGRVRIPVSEAMDEIARHGLPTFEATGDGTLAETNN